MGPRYKFNKAKPVSNKFNKAKPVSNKFNKAKSVSIKLNKSNQSEKVSNFDRKKLCTSAK